MSEINDRKYRDSEYLMSVDNKKTFALLLHNSRISLNLCCLYYFIMNNQQFTIAPTEPYAGVDVESWNDLTELFQGNNIKNNVLSVPVILTKFIFYR